MPKSPDALAPVTVEVVRPQSSVSQSVALDRLVSGDTRQLPTNTQPRPLFDGHVITRLSGKFLHPRGRAVQRRESRTDILGDRRPCDGAAVLSLRAAPYPVAARRRVVTVLVTPLHVDEPAPAALVGVEFFFFPLRPHFRAACSAISAPCFFFFWPCRARGSPLSSSLSWRKAATALQARRALRRRGSHSAIVDAA